MVPEQMAAADPRWFREVLGQYPTGVCVVTAAPTDGRPVGLAVGSFTSVSLDPPLVAFLPDKSSTSWPKIQSVGQFCVNIIGAHQEEVCRRFASKAPDKFETLEWRPAPSGSPIIHGVVAWIDCELETIHEAGDHFIVVGRVLELRIENTSLPLLFFQGGYGRFTPLSLAAPNSQGMLTEQLRLVDLVRPQMEALSAERFCQCIATARLNDELVIVASAGQSAGPAVPTLVGQRVPFVPPVGAPWAAWGSPEVAKAWLSHIPDLHDRERYGDRLAAVRRRGYSVGLLNTAQRKFAATIERLALSPSPERIEELRSVVRDLAYDPVELTPELERDIRIIVAPVFGADGVPALILTVYGFADPAASGGLHSLIERTLSAASSATGAIAAHEPVLSVGQ